MNVFGQYVFDNNDVYCCQISELFVKINELKSSIPFRREFEAYSDYQKRIKPIYEKIEVFKSKSYYATLNFTFTNYDMVNKNFKLTLKLPYNSRRLNDLSPSKTLFYFVSVSPNKAPTFKGKLASSKVRIFFKILNDKMLLILKTKLLYFDQVLKEWE